MNPYEPPRFTAWWEYGNREHRRSARLAWRDTANGKQEANAKREAKRNQRHAKNASKKRNKGGQG